MITIIRTLNKGRKGVVLDSISNTCKGKMTSTTFFASLAVTLLIAFASADNDVQFSYSGSNGPDNWGSLNPSFSACSSGKSQSPINIIKDSLVNNKDLKPLTRDYQRANATLVNNGFNIAVHFESNSGILVIDGTNYTLTQMHWHSPSEHQIDRQQFAAELHLVHKTDSGSISVVSILYQLGDADPFVAKMQSKLEELEKEKCSGDEEAHIPLGFLDNKLLRKNTRKYYRYVGSLTTPPCTENVIWNVLGKVRTISQDQVDALKAPLDDAYKNNSRPLQSLNDRKVDLYDELSN